MLRYTSCTLRFGWYGFFRMPMVLVIVVRFARLGLPDLVQEPSGVTQPVAGDAEREWTASHRETDGVGTEDGGDPVAGEDGGSRGHGEVAGDERTASEDGGDAGDEASTSEDEDVAADEQAE